MKKDLSLILSICIGVVATVQADVVALRSTNGLYVQVRDDNKLYANATAVATWEKFERGWTGEGKMWLKSLKNNLYVCADQNLAETHLIADRPSVGVWESFTRQGGDSYCQLIASNGMYVCADRNLSMTPLHANRSSYGTWESFTIVPQASSSGWVTTFLDNFDGSALNRGNWNVIVGTDGEFNNEAQWYVDEEGVENNFWVSGGTLCIKVQKEQRTFAGRTKQFTSARLTTKNKVERTRGAWEAKICFWKAGSVTGVWPAFWMLGARINEPPIVHSDENVCWPMAGAREIDIWEYTTNTAVVGTYSFITNFISGPYCNQAYGNRLDISGHNSFDWHTYRLEYYGGEVKIFVDGNFKRSASEADFVEPMFCLLNVAIGGNLGGTINFNAGDWAGITVDYVKHQTWQ